MMLALTQLVATCAICGSSKADNTVAFMATTLALALVPIAVFGCGLFFVVRAHRRASANQE
jgi:hypothetical protein